MTTEPHNDGLPKTDEGEIVLKKPPTGSSPCRWLYETLKETRWDRFVKSLGKLPENSFHDKSTYSSLVMFAIAAGIEPVNLLCERILYQSNEH